MFSETSRFHKLRVARSYIERLNIPREGGSVSSSFWLILAGERKIIRLGDGYWRGHWSGRWRGRWRGHWSGRWPEHWREPCSCTDKSGEKAEFLTELHRLRSSSRPEFVENAAGMGLHSALAHKKLPGDFAVAQALGDQFKDLKLTASDMEVLTFSFVRDERSLGRDGDLPHNNCLAFCCQLEAKPDAKNGKGRGDQSPIDFDGMFDDQELILGPLEQGNQDSTDQPVHEDVALHKLQEDSLPKLSHPWQGRSYWRMP
jgi:hypothetical protein